MNDITNRKSSFACIDESIIDNKKFKGKDHTNIINAHFVSVGESEGNDAGDFVVVGTKPLLNSMFKPTTQIEIKILIKTLKNNVAAGIDGFKLVPVERASQSLSHILSYITNRMLLTGIFPNALKTARISPIFKGGEKIVSTIIDRFPFCQFFPKYLKM